MIKICKAPKKKKKKSNRWFCDGGSYCQSSNGRSTFHNGQYHTICDQIKPCKLWSQIEIENLEKLLQLEFYLFILLKQNSFLFTRCDSHISMKICFKKNLVFNFYCLVSQRILEFAVDFVFSFYSRDIVVLKLYKQNTIRTDFAWYRECWMLPGAAFSQCQFFCCVFSCSSKLFKV